MDPETIETVECSWAFVLGCGLPVAALMFAVSGTRLWPTMPAATGPDAMTWALLASVVVSLTLRPPATVKAGAIRLCATAAVLALAWAAGEDSALSLAGSIAIVSILLTALGFLQRRLRQWLLAARALVVAAVAYVVLA